MLIKNKFSLLIMSVLLTIFAYYPGLYGDFTFDDFPNLLTNQSLYIQSIDVDSLIRSALSSDSGILKRPVSMLSFALNGYFFSYSPLSFKIINLLIHLLTGICIYLMTWIILKNFTKYRKSVLPEINNAYLPIIITTLWLIHPLNLTSVLYIVQRMTSLAGLFIILSVCTYVWSRSRYIEKQNGFSIVPITTTIFILLALFSKETGALAPLFMLITELLIFRFQSLSGKIDYKIVLYFTIYLLAPITIILISLIFNPDFLLGAYKLRDFTLLERLLTESRVLIFYLKLTLLPSITELGLFHDDITVSRSLFNPITTFFSVLSIAGMFIISVASFKKQPLISFGLLWFFSGHVLESTILPLEIAHEHRNYLSIYGIIFSLACILNKFNFAATKLPVRTIIVIITISVLTFTTNLRAYQWSDNILHAIYEAQHHPKSPRALFSAGRIYANLTIYAKEDKIYEAMTLLEKSMLLDRTSILPNVSLIMFSFKTGQPIKRKWIEDAEYKLANVAIQPTSIAAMKELVKCQQSDCRLSDKTMESLFHYSLSNRQYNIKDAPNPDMVTIYAYHTINNKKDYNMGKSLFLEAIEIAPDDIQYRLNLIDLLIIMKQYKEAKHHLKIIMKLNSLGRYNDQIRSILNLLSERSME